SDVTPVDPDDGGSDGKPSNPQYRADIGAYLGNQWLARELQMQTLFDREDSQYRSHEGDLWLREKAETRTLLLRMEMSTWTAITSGSNLAGISPPGTTVSKV
ncbi:TPA: autotransporter outer membrane beta-barrel domain-containing protein, partial [Citrobacter freundii]|nr:autotransporter outer membrane beta-barrel domain-containing protein [Citrobacter freundii]